MAKANSAVKEIKLSCHDAQLILQVMPAEKEYGEMKLEEQAATDHYVNCRFCWGAQKLGKLLDLNLGCRRAILLWAKRPCALYQGAQTPLEICAVEHVWGKRAWDENGGRRRDDSPCSKHPCLSLARYWDSVPMSSSYNGGSGVIHLFPFLFRMFFDEKWPHSELLEIQKKRIENVLGDIKKGKISSTVSNGHYDHIEELFEEIEEHFNALRMFGP